MLEALFNQGLIMGFLADTFLVSREEAVDLGLTHEGTVYGLPAWLSVDRDAIKAVPKFYPARFVMWLADCMLELVAAIASADRYFEVPYSIRRPIQG